VLVKLLLTVFAAIFLLLQQLRLIKALLLWA
jgi:hypothetical protein